MKKFETGLVVGKFSPLHQGHEALIRFANSQCEKLFIISYSNPGIAKCDRLQREAWLKSATYGMDVTLCVMNEFDYSLPRQMVDAGWVSVPKDEDSESTHRQFCASICLNVFETEIDAVFTSETYGDGLAKHIENFFNTRLKTSNKVEHVCFDLDRKTIPISATNIRNKEPGWEKFLSIKVRADFVPRVAIVGGESSGKTTLAQALTVSLSNDNFTVTNVAEYGRTLWEQRGGKLKYQHMQQIAEQQIELEHTAAFWSILDENKQSLVICDTTPLTTLFYSDYLFNFNVSARLSELAQRQYDAYILCEPDFEFVQDGTRQDSAFRTRGHQYFSEFLRHNTTPHIRVSGSIENRVEQVKNFLSEQNFWR